MHPDKQLLKESVAIIKDRNKNRTIHFVGALNLHFDVIKQKCMPNSRGSQ